jgi:hypothetical protein
VYASARRMAATCAYDSDMRLDKGHLSKQSTRIPSPHHPYHLFHHPYSHVHSNRQNTAKHVSRTNLATKGIRFPMETPIESPGQAVRGAHPMRPFSDTKMDLLPYMRSNEVTNGAINYDRARYYITNKSVSFSTSWSEIVCSSGTSIRKIR